MNDREFWILIRQALLTMVKAIERKYKLGSYAKGDVIESVEDDTVTISFG